jgi:hypothetical protein
VDYVFKWQVVTDNWVFLIQGVLQTLMVTGISLSLSIVLG